jgi:CDP-glucose 4,6-dehydratase
MGFASARAGNVIGGGDWAADRIVPDCIRAIEQDKPIQLRQPNSTRPWQHVLEPLSGYLLLAQRLREDAPRFNGAWNFGPSTSEVRNVKSVADMITRHFGRGQVDIVASPGDMHEAQLLQLNCDKAHQQLGWRPRWSVDRTLVATAQWYKAVLAGESAETISRAQIRDYFPEIT